MRRSRSLFLGVALASLAGSVHANDLVIEEFDLELRRAGNLVYPTADDTIVWLSPIQSFQADLDVAVSWPCQVSLFQCVNRKPAFEAVIELVAWEAPCPGCILQEIDSFAYTPVEFEASEVRYRNIPLVGEGPESKQFSVTLGGGAAETWIAGHASAGRVLRVRLRIDTADEVAESNELNNDTHETVPRLLPLSGELSFGPTGTQMIVVGTIAPSAPFCGGGSGTAGNQFNLRIQNATTVWSPGASTTWEDIPVPLADICAHYDVAGPGGLPLDSLTSVSAGDLVQQTAGLEVTYVDNTLDHVSGAAPLQLSIPLPDGLSSHGWNSAGSLPATQGSSILVLDEVTVPSPEDYDALQVSGTNAFLNAEGLPFALAFSALHHTVAGLNGIYLRSFYAHGLEYAVADSRHVSKLGPRSNDKRFAQDRFLQTDRTFTLDGNGLHIAQIDYDAEPSFLSHYPRLAGVIDAFSVSVSSSRFEARGDLAPSLLYEFDLNPDCAACPAGGDPVPYALTPLATEAIATDGAVMTRVAGVPNAEWGPLDAGTDQRIFTRLDDAGSDGVLFFPGGLAQDTASPDSLGAVEYLLGMRTGQELAGDAPDVLRPATHYARHHAQARRGNGFGAGVTLGPEHYSLGADQQPDVGDGHDLTNSRTRIGFGGLASLDFENISAAPATKIIARAGGITGAFNTFVPPQPTLYGHPLELDRFAFRLRSNVLDALTWMDGRIAVPGRGDFDLVFESMNLACSGEVSEGLLDNDESMQTLGAWQTDVELLAMSFVTTDPSLPVCEAKGRELLVTKTMDLRALDEPLSLSAVWTPQGDPEQARLSGATDRVVDRPKGDFVDETEDQGFALALDSNNLVLDWPGSSTTDGWVGMEGEFGVPFWNALAVDARLANQSPQVQSQSIVVKRDNSLTADDDNLGNPALADELASSTSADSDARYTWGATGFKINLPVHYEAGRHATGRGPRFLGRTKSRELLVLEANSGVDYIRPDQTKLSFGASADFENLRLLDFDLHVSPDGSSDLAGIDAQLCLIASLCINFMQSNVSEIFTALGDLKENTGAGMEERLETGIRAGLAHGPFQISADALARVRSMPEYVAAGVEVSLRETAAAALLPFEDSIYDDDMRFSYQELGQLYVDAAGGTPDLAGLDLARGRLVTAQARLDKVLHGDSEAIGLFDLNFAASLAVFARINQLRESFFTDVDSAKQQLADALAQIESEVDALALDACPSQVSPGWALIDNAGQAFDHLVTVLGVLPSLTSIVPIPESTTDSEAWLEEYEATTENLSKIASGLKGRLSALCDTEGGLKTALQNVADDADALLANINASVLAAELALDTIEEALLPGADDQGILVDLSDELGVSALDVAAIRGVLDKHIDYIDQASNSFADFYPYQGLSPAQIQSALDDEIALATSNRFRWLYPAGADPERSFVAEMGKSLREPIDQSIAAAGQETTAQLANIFSGVPRADAEELKRLVINRLLNSEGVHLLLSAIERHSVDDVDKAGDAVFLIIDVLNNFLKLISDQVDQALGSSLLNASGIARNNMPLSYVSLDGYGVISGNELDRLHLQAAWASKLSPNANGTEFSAALDITRWSANNKELGCVPIDSDSLLDAVLSFYSAPMGVWNAGTLGKNFYLGFILQTERDMDELPIGTKLRGAFGGVSVGKKMDFGEANPMKPSSINLAFMLSKDEQYLAGAGKGSVKLYEVGVNFLLGNTCNPEIIVLTVPDLGEMISLPEDKLRGVVIVGHGGVKLPLPESVTKYINVGVEGRMGFWFLLEGDFEVGLGGSYAGGVYANLLKLGAVRGQFDFSLAKSGLDVTSLLSSTLTTEGLNFGGEIWAGLGAGFCEPKKWTSISKVREDKLCGTLDMRFGAYLQNGIVGNKPTITGIR